MSRPIASQKMHDLIASIIDLVSEKNGNISVAHLRNGIGTNSFGEIIFMLAVIELSPIGSIPGVPTLLAILIIIVSMQIAIGKERIWLPRWLENKEIDRSKLLYAMYKIQKITSILSFFIRPRAQRLFNSIIIRVAAIFVIVTCCFVPILEIVPFASTIPMTAIAILGLSIIFKDGVLLLLSVLCFSAALSFMATNLTNP